MATREVLTGQLGGLWPTSLASGAPKKAKWKSESVWGTRLPRQVAVRCSPPARPFTSAPSTPEPKADFASQALVTEIAPAVVDHAPDSLYRRIAELEALVAAIGRETHYNGRVGQTLNF
jgi:hypothetical protein